LFVERSFQENRSMSTEPKPATSNPAPKADVPPVAAVAAVPSPHPPKRQRKGWFGQTFGSGGADDQIVVYHHATLFYWWPVWLLGFGLALATYFDHKHLAIVPAGTTALEKKVPIELDGKTQTRHVLVLPEGKDLITRGDGRGGREIFQPQFYVSSHRGYGTAYSIILLLVIAMTNISVRGLWSVFVLVLVVMLSIIFYLSGWWGVIFHHMGQLSVFLNMGGYIVISTVLFILWVLNVFIFDRQTYMIFTPGQVRVRLVIGGEETVYDTSGMVVQRQRNDMFRHWILGFGSGDLVIRPMGLTYALELDNVLNVSAVVKRVERMIKEKVVVRGAGGGH
jgi:hypothetical protein